MILKTKGRIKARSENVSRERSIKRKAANGLEMELANFSSKRLEGIYFRLQAKEVKSKVLRKYFIRVQM